MTGDLSSGEFAAVVGRLLSQIEHWTAARWASGPGGEIVHALVQELAGLAADAEGEPRRAVPRLDDIVLPDQLTVLANDLVAARPTSAALAAAVEAVRATSRALG